MSTARKARILGVSPVSDYVTDTREGMDNIADAIRTLAGVMAACAAAAHTKTAPQQQDLAGAIYLDAQNRFADVLKRMTVKNKADLDAYLAALLKVKK